MLALKIGLMIGGALMLAALLWKIPYLVVKIAGLLRLDRKRQNFINGPWQTNLAVGGEGMGLMQRAMVAKYGLWALKSSETIYFTTFFDSDRRPLNVRNRYRIEGAELDARWWAVTVYRDFHFIPNDHYRYSFAKTNLSYNPDYTWTVRLSSERQEGNWIPLGDREGILNVSLRLYNPGPTVYAGPDRIKLPRIIRE